MYSQDQSHDPSFGAGARASQAATHGAADEVPRASDARPEVDAVIAELRGDGRKILRSLRRVATVEWKRLNLHGIDASFRWASYLCGFGFALTFAVAAALLFVNGIRNALVAWIGIPWVADLCGGIVLISAIVVGGLVTRDRFRKRLLRSARRAMATGDSAPAKAGSR